MRCISRITDDTYAQYFGNGRNKFYVEFRCSRPCINDLDICAKCFEKNSSCKLQDSRKFNHGKVNEPIPDESHIYGGKWFHNSAKKWGQPSVEIIEFANQYQLEARGEYVVVQPPFESSKDSAHDITQEMPCSKKTVTTGLGEGEGEGEGDNVPKKRTRKPKVATGDTGNTDTNVVTSVPSDTTLKEPDVLEKSVISEPKKRTRKPKVATENVTETVTDINAVPTDQLETKKKGKGTGKGVRRKKVEESPYASLISTTKQLVHKEVVVPTHIESKLETFDADGYEIEYVRLASFEYNGTTYFRDSKKNKLYKKTKDKIGEYIGRWNPENDSIVVDVPDSDGD